MYKITEMILRNRVRFIEVVKTRLFSNKKNKTPGNGTRNVKPGTFAAKKKRYASQCTRGFTRRKTHCDISRDNENNQILGCFFHRSHENYCFLF